MRGTLATAVLVLALLPAAAADPTPEAPRTAWPDYPIDDAMAAVLEKINAVGPYEVPQLGVKRDHNYALTPEDVEPFGGVRPFKEHW